MTTRPDGQGRSGQEIGAEHVMALKRYLDATNVLPARGGKVNLSAVALGAGFDRQVLYKNPMCARLLEQAVKDKGIIGVETREDAEADAQKLALERRLSQLERMNITLMAENEALRERVKRLEHIERHVVATGRMVR